MVSLSKRVTLLRKIITISLINFVKDMVAWKRNTKGWGAYTTQEKPSFLLNQGIMHLTCKNFSGTFSPFPKVRLPVLWRRACVILFVDRRYTCSVSNNICVTCTFIAGKWIDAGRWQKTMWKKREWKQLNTQIKQVLYLTNAKHRLSTLILYAAIFKD